MKNKETKKQSWWKVWKSGGPTIHKGHIVWEGQTIWRNLPHVNTKRDILQICVAFSEKLSFTYQVFWMNRFCFYFCINMCIAFFVAFFVPFLNYESAHLISSKWTVEIPSQIGFQGPSAPWLYRPWKPIWDETAAVPLDEIKRTDS